MTGCRIGKVKPKTGGEIHLLPPPKCHPVRSIEWEWGKVTVESFEGDDLTHERLLYMLESAIREFWDGNL